MKNKVLNLFKVLFFQIKYKYLLTGSLVRVKGTGRIYIGKNVLIRKSTIVVYDDSFLEILNDTVIKKSNLHVKGEVHLGEGVIVEPGYQRGKVELLNDGILRVGKRTRIRSKIWTRFGGVVSIGEYTNINEETEIRADESVEIGDFCQISYKCVIWDTNTHNMYEAEPRRKLTVDHYPEFGYEYEKPKTKPVRIGNDCWIAREVAVLKGTRVGDRAVIGYRTTLSNCRVEEDTSVVPEISNRIMSMKKQNC